MDHNEVTQNILRHANRVKDQLVRLETHQSFLTQCLDLDIIPQGLRLKFRNTFDNSEDDIRKTNTILNQASKQLIHHALETIEKNIEATITDLAKILA